MRYMGRKARVGKELARVIHARTVGADHYLEPFVGGGGAFAAIAPAYRVRIASDAMPDIALLWAAVAAGWIPPSVVTREEYAALRHGPPSALRAFVGFGCSFGGKWFGGYASARGDDYAGQSARSVEAKRSAFVGAYVTECDYRTWGPADGWVVYCDPPYAGTTRYSGAPPWDPEEFWVWATRAACAGAQVFVSEYSAPAGWEPIWSRELAIIMKATDNAGTVVEKLFHLEI